MSPGERVFRDQGCGSCHTLASAGSGTAAPTLDGKNLGEARVRAVVSNGTKGMPGYQLSASDLKALARFVAIQSRAK